MNISNVDVNIAVKGKNLKLLGHQGRTWLLAKEGSEYTIRVKNDNPFRTIAIVSIDGIDTISGKPASLKDGGYIVDAYSSAEIKGYRKSLQEAAAFRFTRKEKAYATEKGIGENVGVIAVAVFKEKDDRFEKLKKEYEELLKKKSEKEYVPYPVYPYRPWYPYNPWYDGYCWRTSPYYGDIIGGSATHGQGSCTAATYNTTNSSFSNTSGGELKAMSAVQANTSIRNDQINLANQSWMAGSTWGKKLDDVVKEVPFERENDTPFALFNIYYDFRAGLEKFGVKLEAEETEVSFPQGFTDFCSPPKDWIG